MIYKYEIPYIDVYGVSTTIESAKMSISNLTYPK